MTSAAFRKGLPAPRMPISARTIPSNARNPPMKSVVTPGLTDFSTVTSAGDT